MTTYSISMMERSGVPYEYMIESERQLTPSELIAKAREELSSCLLVHPERIHFTPKVQDVPEPVVTESKAKKSFDLEIPYELILTGLLCGTGALFLLAGVAKFIYMAIFNPSLL